MKPHLMYSKIYDITPEVIQANNIKGLMIDMDNTILPWEDTNISEQAHTWIQGLIDSGIRVCIITNSGYIRARQVMGETDYVYIHRALKPLPFNFTKARKLLGTKRDETFVVGDQLMTDFIGSKLSGHKCILVEPMSQTEHRATRFSRFVERAILGRDVRGNFDKK